MLNKILETLDKAVVSDVKVYDVRSITPFYDYSIVCSAASSRQALACVNYIKDEAIKNNMELRGYSNNTVSNWYLVDLNEIVVHIFVGEERALYNLDEMYNQALK